MEWKFPKFKPGKPHRWEFLLPPGSAKKTTSLLETVLSQPFLPRTHTPTFTVHPEKFILEKANFRQALEVLVRVPWVRDFRLNLGKFPLEEDFSFSGFKESLRAAELLPADWDLRFHPQVRGRTEISRESLDFLWEEVYPDAPNTELLTELNVLSVGEDLILSLSLAGEPLFKRGNFRSLSKSAPVREDTAVFLLSLLEEKMPNPEAVFVPFAGSGTFVWESASLFLGVGFPHLDRSYLFKNLEEFPEPTWEFLRKRIGEKGENKTFRLWWNEIEEDTFSYLEERSSEYQKFIKRIRPDLKISITGEEADFFSLSPKEIWNSVGSPKKIWMPLNPPYGLRIKQGSAVGLYRHIAEALKEWWALSAEISGFILCPDEETWSSFLKGIGSRAETIHITHGGIDLRVVYF